MAFINFYYNLQWKTLSNCGMQENFSSFQKLSVPLAIAVYVSWASSKDHNCSTSPPTPGHTRYPRWSDTRRAPCSGLQRQKWNFHDSCMIWLCLRIKWYIDKISALREFSKMTTDINGWSLLVFLKIRKELENKTFTSVIYNNIKVNYLQIIPTKGIWNLYEANWKA